MGAKSARAAAAVAIVVVMALAACTSTEQAGGERPEAQASPPPPPPPPPPPQPPPVDMAGRWRFAATGTAACFMNFGNAPAAGQGTIKPEAGCPGNFFTSRKWTFEHGVLIIRNHKDDPLAQLTFSGGRFEGHETGGAALTLSR